MDKKHGLLIVDDEEDIVDQLYDYFRLDYTVHKATSGAEALEILEENEIHLIMTDQRMEKMQGTELLKESKKNHPEITRFLMTGYTDLEVAINAINEGNIHRYLSKPLNFEALPDIIAAGITHHEEVVKIKDNIDLEKNNILGKVKTILSDFKTVELNKDALEKELEAQKEEEENLTSSLHKKIEVITQEKEEFSKELLALNEKNAKMVDEFESAIAEAKKVKTMEDENKKLNANMAELESKYTIANKSTISLKSDMGKISVELNNSRLEKEKIEKKLKQFQANWAKAAGA